MTNETTAPQPAKSKRPKAKKSQSSGKRRSAISTDRLKTTLVVGGLLATYLGADLLASADSPQAIPEASPQMAQIFDIPSSTAAEGFTLTLDPIADVVSADQIPMSVAKSRSSK